ncbi:NAD/NADP transhydrogenase beta subunit [Vibrio campbellii]|uniref:NAD/NADP transhydrogenase beta subunit n=1 Tax=Vibrio campbellii TaxID=680 RepID=UPI001F07BBF9|nr:NAD/NADP transhydrogenase beta subunit [Vibrio campbellii]UMM06267.1 NAD/NADP transhydrogenase beta subunit [Vibrio campbellii]
MALLFQSQLCMLGDQAFSVEQLANNTLRPSENNELIPQGMESSVLPVYDRLTHYSKALSECGIEGQVYLLLPKLSDKVELQRITTLLLSVFQRVEPQHLALYPYGSASFLMALSRIKREVKQTKPLWIVALHVADAKGEHDSLVVARCSAQKQGLIFNKIAIDLQLDSNNTAVSNVVKQLGKSCVEKLDELMLSAEGNEPVWLDSIQFLSPWVNRDTSYRLIGTTTGPLGASGGVLKAICACLQPKETRDKNYSGIQLDIERGGYAVGATYRWGSE